MDLTWLRSEVVATAREMSERGLVSGTAGNVSRRDPASGWVAITPTGRSYASLTVEEVSLLDQTGRLQAGEPPSREAPLHLSLYQARSNIGSVVHTHSAAVSALAILGVALPPVLVEMALAVGGEVPCAPYRRPGTRELGAVVVETLREGRAVILANHGLVAVGPDGASALEVARLVEETAAAYLWARAVGQPRPLTPEEYGHNPGSTCPE